MFENITNSQIKIKNWNKFAWYEAFSDMFDHYFAREHPLSQLVHEEGFEWKWRKMPFSRIHLLHTQTI